MEVAASRDFVPGEAKMSVNQDAMVTPISTTRAGNLTVFRGYPNAEGVAVILIQAVSEEGAKTSIGSSQGTAPVNQGDDIVSSYVKA